MPRRSRRRKRRHRPPFSRQRSCRCQPWRRRTCPNRRWAAPRRGCRRRLRHRWRQPVRRTSLLLWVCPRQGAVRRPNTQRQPHRCQPRPCARRRPRRRSPRHRARRHPASRHRTSRHRASRRQVALRQCRRRLQARRHFPAGPVGPTGPGWVRPTLPWPAKDLSTSLNFARGRLSRPAGRQGRPIRAGLPRGRTTVIAGQRRTGGRRRTRCRPTPRPTVASRRSGGRSSARSPPTRTARGRSALPNEWSG